MRAHRRVIGPCPNGDGEIVERPHVVLCTSWKSKAEPGCGYQIWKRIGGRVITPEEAAEFVAKGITGDEIAAQVRAERTVIGPCPNPAAAARSSSASKLLRLHVVPARRTEPGLRLRDLEEAARQAARSRSRWRSELLAHRRAARGAATSEPIGDCPTPDCGGKIVENSRAFGCTSWKSRKEPGCGFVIWKTPARPRRGVTRAGDRDAPGGQLRAGRQPRRRLASRSARARPRAAAAPSSPTAPAGAATRGSRSRSPGCGFAIWRKQQGREITREEALALLERGETELPESSSDAA